MPTILLKKSDTPGSVPGTANLTNLAGGAEVAVNTADKRMFSMTSASAVIELGTNPSSLTCADASFTVARVGSLTISSLSLTNATVTSATVTTLTGTSANITTLTGTNLSYASATITTGNLTFSGTGQRITGDMSNATVSSRLYFQNSVTNGVSVFGVIPNGTATTSRVSVWNASDPTNSSWGDISVTSAEFQVRSNQIGTGTYLPMTFYTNGSERMRLDTSGNLGIGTSSPGSRVTLGVNATDTALSGTSNTAGLHMYVRAFGVAQIDSIQSGANNSGMSLRTYNNGTYTAFIENTQGNTTTFATAGSERLRIDSSGNVGIGGTASAFDRVTVTGTLPSSSAISIGFGSRGTIPSGTTSQAASYSSVPATQAASFTLNELVHYWALQGTFGAGSTVTNQFGFRVDSSLTGATNNYGFYSDIASGSNRWNFYAAGTADNYFAGRVFFTSTNATPATNNVEGMAWTTSKNLQVSCEGDPLFINRKASDGSLVNFYQDGAVEGSISVAGNTVSYNPFMGSHYTEIVGAMPTLKGTVLESIDELVNGKYSNQDRLPKAKISDTAGSNSVYGVYFSPDSDPDTNDGILAAALGASWVRIAAGITVQRGDLLESNGDGCAKVQSDEIIRSKTIGKVTSTTVAETYPDGSYIVPCVLYCG